MVQAEDLWLWLMTSKPIVRLFTDGQAVASATALPMILADREGSPNHHDTFQIWNFS